MLVARKEEKARNRKQEEAWYVVGETPEVVVPEENGEGSSETREPAKKKKTVWLTLVFN